MGHAFPVRILALDPSLRSTGYAILEGTAEKPAVLASGTIKNPASRTSQDCLIEIHDRLSELISQHSPTALAIELIIYVQNTRTAVILGAARGVALLAAARLVPVGRCCCLVAGPPLLIVLLAIPSAAATALVL